jgi:L-fucose isomerase-like protein
MPTSLSSDVVPLRKTTKRMLAGVKGRDSYDDLLGTLLEAVPPEELRRALARKRALAGNAAKVRAQMDERIRRGLERSPEKQLLIAKLARERWARWEREGRIERVGPRVVAWRPMPTGGERRMDLVWQRRRGFPAEEGA